MGKIEAEKKTVARMIQIYCRSKHGSTQMLCDECETLRRYAVKRLDKCPFQDKKGACKTCSVHCYSSDMRARIRTVMRFSGPRMMLFLPFEFIKHQLKSRF